jgi:ankyrin repeat protein
LIDRFGCDKEDEAAVKFLNDYDITNLINYKEGEHWRTSLFAACQWGMFRSVKVLLDKGADITILTLANKNALHAAAQIGSLECCKLLCEARVELNQQDTSDETPLDKAIIYDRKEAG